MTSRSLKPNQIASSEAIRNVNRRIVLNLIRTRHPISRADLARVSGMQRSTISLIVEELISEDWVIEGPTGRLPRGRRPTFLHLNEDRVIVGVDIRPTQTTVALADVNGNFTAQETFRTPRDAAEAIALLIKRIRAYHRCLRKAKKIEGIGISVARPHRSRQGSLVFAPNLKWRDIDLGSPIAKATGLDVELENAANACVLAAVWFDRMEDMPEPGRGHRLRRHRHRHLSRTVNWPAATTTWRANSVTCRSIPRVRSAPAAAADAGKSSPPIAPPFATITNRSRSRTALILRICSAWPIWAITRAAKALDTMAHYLGRGMRMIVAGLAPERIIVIGDLTGPGSASVP